MINNFKKEKTPFTQVANEVLNNKKLSFKAKGLYSYLFSKPDGWDFSSVRIKEDGTDGRKGILSGLKELEDAGFLSRKKLGDGRVDYLLKYSTQSPQTALRDDNPESPKGTMPKGHAALKATISNKDNTSNKEQQSNKDSPAAEAAGGDEKKHEPVTTERAEKQRDEVNELIDCFSDVNPSFERFFKNKTQRQAIHNLLKIHPNKQIKAVIGLLKQTNRIAFMPTITTPLQLEEKWASLEAGMIKYKAKLQEKQAADNKPKGKKVSI